MRGKSPKSGNFWETSGAERGRTRGRSTLHSPIGDRPHGAERGRKKVTPSPPYPPEIVKIWQRSTSYATRELCQKLKQFTAEKF